MRRAEALTSGRAHSADSPQHAICSKQFTGFAVALLIEQNLMSLDDKLGNLLSEFADSPSQNVTVGEML